MYRRSFGVLLFFGILSALAQAQAPTIAPVPSAGTHRITVTHLQVNAGSTFAIFSSTVAGTCNVTDTPVPLLAGSSNLANAPGPSTLIETASDFTQGETICAALVQPGAGIVISPPVVVAPKAAAAVVGAVPTIQPVPVAGQDFVTVSRGGLPANSAVTIYSPPAGGSCTVAAPVLALAPGATNILSTPVQAILLSSALATGMNVCAIVTPPGGGATIPAAIVQVKLAPAAPTQTPFGFVGSVTISGPVLINGTAGHSVALFEMIPGATACNTASISGTALAIVVGTSTAAAITLQIPAAPASAPPFAITLSQPLTLKATICAQDLGASGDPLTGVWSSPAVVASQPAVPGIPVFEVPTVGSSTISVTGRTGDRISVYLVNSTDQISCSTIDPKDRHLLTVTSATTSTAVTLASDSQDVTLSSPLVLGKAICVSETATGFSPSWSVPLVVIDPDNTGRVSSYFIAGIQASNQLSANTTGNNSTTAGQYLELGLNNSFVRAKDRVDRGERGTPRFSTKKDRVDRGERGTPGFSTNIDVRFSPIPVAATQTTSTSGATSTVTPSVLSSQQSARIVGSMYAPWKTTSWNHHNDFFTVAPLARGGFGTLINPSTSSNMGTSTNPAVGVTTTSYSPAYYFWGLGARVAWERYSSSTDLGPRTFAQAMFIVGEYSNLPSFVCKPISSGDYPANGITVVTACNQGQYAPTLGTNGAVVGNTFGYFRTVRPRLDFEGFIKHPNYPFILGLDANLPQYGVGSRSNLDYLNKPGADIRIYVGLIINLNNFLTRSGISLQ